MFQKLNVVIFGIFGKISCLPVREGTHVTCVDLNRTKVDENRLVGGRNNLREIGDVNRCGRGGDLVGFEELRLFGGDGKASRGLGGVITVVVVGVGQGFDVLVGCRHFTVGS